jgi:ankyrin repeat protein
MLDLLIRAGVVLDPPGASLSGLHSAVGFGLLPMIQALVLAGANTKSTDAFGATALDWAHQLGPVDSEIVDLLGGDNRLDANHYAGWSWR